MFYELFNDKVEITIICFFIMFFGLLISPKIFENIKPLSREVVKYKVTIDSDYDINELYDKYDVIEVEGKIFTIEEKR